MSVSLESVRGRGPGFTLLEVMIAVVLTSVVAMMAVASARVSVEAASIVQDKLTSVRSDRAVRQTLLDLLHNVRPARARGDTSLALAGDTLTFTAAGVAPLDPEYDWLIAMHPGDSGLAIDARTVGRGPAARVDLRLPRVTRWQVRVLPPQGSEWKDRWVPSPVLPSAVAISLWSHQTPLGPPLTVRMSDAASAQAESDYMME